jgi:hypothetical protein
MWSAAPACQPRRFGVRSQACHRHYAEEGPDRQRQERAAPAESIDKNRHQMNVMKKRRGSIRSANPKIALVRLPTTNPACTPLVSDACKNGDNRYSASSAGTTAEAENQSAIAATWHRAMMVIATGLVSGTGELSGLDRQTRTRKQSLAPIDRTLP